jgi:hypothetical protein
MNRYKIFSILMPGLLIFLASCSPVANLPTPTPVASTAVPPTVLPTESPPEWQPFSSERFDYTISVPADWFPKERFGTWPDYDPLDAKMGTGIDAFAAYLDQRVLTLGIGARDLPADTTLESWVETAKSLIVTKPARGVCYETPEDEPVSAEQILLDGELAVLLEYHCPQVYDSFGLVVLAIHRGQGFWITWISPQGQAAEDRLEFMQILDTFSFADN